MHPEIEPDERGMLEVGDGNRIHWEISGNPAGIPAVVLHGGPGSGCTSGMRRFFDPARYRVVLFDQRGCGRSTPHASQPSTDLTTNTTAHLVADLERLRGQVGADKWLLFGVSWGSTLGLAYAERHPDRVAGCVFAGVTTGRRSEIDGLYRDAEHLAPAAWQRFRSGVPPSERDGDLIAAYHRLLEDPDPGVRERAAGHWTDWDWLTASVDPDAEQPPHWLDRTFQLARARIVTHYFTNDCFLDDGVLLRGAPTLEGIPAVLINGGADKQSPPATAAALHRAWPGSELVVVEDAGHSVGEAAMTEAIVDALDRTATQLS